MCYFYNESGAFDQCARTPNQTRSGTAPVSAQPRSCISQLTPIG